MISADVQQTWIGSDQSLRGLLVNAMHTDGKWQFATARGATENGAPFSLDMRPAEGDLSTISFAAEDVGGTLAAFGIYPDMRGGRLTGSATGIVSADNIQLTGELRVNRFHLVRAPVLARMLDLLAITGLRDVLSGRGIGFTSLRASFAINNNVIELRSARASGSTLGMTGSGTVDLDQNTVEMSGTLIPFFWANNALGNLPLIGGWLTGGEDGGGVFPPPTSLADSSMIRRCRSIPTASCCPHSFAIFSNSFRAGSVPQTILCRCCPQTRPEPACRLAGPSAGDGANARSSRVL